MPLLLRRLRLQFLVLDETHDLEVLRVDVPLVGVRAAAHRHVFVIKADLRRTQDVVEDPRMQGGWSIDQLHHFGVQLLIVATDARLGL